MTALKDIRQSVDEMQVLLDDMKIAPTAAETYTAVATAFALMNAPKEVALTTLALSSKLLPLIQRNAPVSEFREALKSLTD